MITQAELKALLDYDPNTGKVYWKKSGSGRRVNREAGSIGVCQDGYKYMRIKIQQKEYKLAHVIVRYMTGEEPYEVDHQNHNALDNTWSNLMPHYGDGNQRNKSLRKRNSMGIPGVYWIKGEGTYAVYIGSGQGSRPKYLGRFKDFFEACCARKSAEIRYGYHPNHGKR